MLWLLQKNILTFGKQKLYYILVLYDSWKSIYAKFNH